MESEKLLEEAYKEAERSERRRKGIMFDPWMTYYEIRNTVTEWGNSGPVVSGQYATIEAAIGDLPNHSDYYSEQGTGTIYRINVEKDDYDKVRTVETPVYRSSAGIQAFLDKEEQKKYEQRLAWQKRVAEYEAEDHPRPTPSPMPDVPKKHRKKRRTGFR